MPQAPESNEECDESLISFALADADLQYVAQKDADAALRIARDTGYIAWLGGRVERHGNRKAVEIEPLGITFDAESLQVR